MIGSLKWLVLAALVWSACGASDAEQRVSPEALAAALQAACPVVQANDATAHARCAEQLAYAPLLRSVMGTSLLWGAQSPDAGSDPRANNTTRFHPFVFRNMYLSVFMFTGEQRVEQDGERTVVRLPVHFRSGLDVGDYPYPFWHSERKWLSYERARELLFVIEGGVVAAVLRSAEQDETRPHSALVWDQAWTWQSARGPEPRAALFSSLFSATNPHVAELEQAFRSLSEEQRSYECTNCHDPSNKGASNPLTLLTYPNQALSGRHLIVAQLETSQMPPGGIADQAARERLLALARSFATIGDRAFAHEDEPIRD